MEGSFDIECVRLPNGTTAIGKQQVSAPWHLSKPYWDGKTLLIQSVNMTAGVFSGDKLSLNAHVKPNASALLTSPSASRIHTMPEGKASLEQTICVDERAWLEWMPELFIPQRQCRYEQFTTLDVQRGGSMYAVETLAPGRVAHGEVFAFESVRWSTRLLYDQQLMLRETYTLKPDDHSLHDLRNDQHPKYYASIIIVHDALPAVRELQSATEGMNSSRVSLGISSLAPNIFQAKVLAASSPDLKEALHTFRAVVADHIDELLSSARKL